MILRIDLESHPDQADATDPRRNHLGLLCGSRGTQGLEHVLA